jgi:hypothetical protein
MTSFSSVQYTSSGTPRAFPQVKQQVHLGKDARSSHVLYFVCFGEETWNCTHFLVILSLKTLWAGLNRWRTALRRFYVYRNTYFISHGSKMCTFEVILLCVWCLDNWSRKKHWNFIWPSLPFSLPRIHYFFFFHHFFSWSVIGVFGLFSCNPRFMAHIDSPWLVKFSKMTSINFRESWFGFFFKNWDLWPETITQPRLSD